ncbi:MAG: hypothetical protein NUV91_00945 [Candidatus Omnitrophica bacterium]|nr:hypothetical protein [Candidatus Omnitrophota bacterium]
MSIVKLIRKILSPLLFLNIVRRYQGRSALIKIKAAQFYVQGVQKARIVSLGLILALISLVFLAGGLTLIHTALFSYSMWSVEVKFFVALLLGILEFLGAIGILFHLFREETWAKFSEVENVVNSVVDGTKQEKRSEAGVVNRN